tara:strand:- start:2822 stop:3181 length:360 start_codon:yes stop_codon:yes gene_type:complete
MNSFQKSYSLNTRKEESNRIMTKYEGKIPIIVNRGYKADIADIDKKKFLVPGDLTIAQFTSVIRKRIKLGSEQAIFIFVKSNDKEIIPLQSASVESIYHSNKNEDGFLYITYAGENVFG